MLESIDSSEPADITVPSLGRLSVTNPEPKDGNDEAGKPKSRPVRVTESPFNELPGDMLIYVFSWLEMNDMISASQVSTHWRQIALSSASLWQDVRLTNHLTTTYNRFNAIALRAKEAPLNVTIVADAVGDLTWTWKGMQSSILRVLHRYGHRIGSLELDIACRDGICMLAPLSIFKDAVKSASQAGMKHLPSWMRQNDVCVRFPDCHAMRTVELRHGICPCALRFSTVTNVLLVDFHWVSMATMERVCIAFPGVTSLSITADKVPYFGQERAPEYFIEQMSRVERLSVVTKLFRSEANSVAGVLRWPVRRIELDVSASGNGFARHVRSILRELLTSKESVLAIRSTRQRNSTGEWTPKYFVIVRVGSGAGRELIFIHESFTRVMQNYVAPLLREKQVQEIVVDGHAACALFYAACGTADLAHITTLRIVTGDSSSIRAPQKEVRLSRLKQLVLEKDPMGGSRITAMTVEGLLSKLVTDERVSLRLKDVFVYADGDQVDIGQYADLVESAVYPPSWRHIASPTA